MKHLAQQAQALRRDALQMIYAAQSGHPGSSFSCMEILTLLYFGGYVRIDPKNPKATDRDYCILSKGHAAPALYAVLGELGFFPKEEFFALRQRGALLQGHPEPFIPGVEVATGPLGQGLSVANGIALALRLDKKPNRVFSIHGDGELQEGNIWEAIMTAAHYHLDNLVAIVDRNQLQIDGRTEEIKHMGDVAEKFRVFGWETFEVADGHDLQALALALDAAIAVKGKPSVIVAHTTKGKGVSFMENAVGWHGKAPNEEQYQAALAELSVPIS